MNKRKLITTFTLISIITLSLVTNSSTVCAANHQTANMTNAMQPAEDIAPRAEVTEWKYRVVNNKMQKRLWSVTYGQWLTAWEWV